MDYTVLRWTRNILLYLIDSVHLYNKHVMPGKGHSYIIVVISHEIIK